MGNILISGGSTCPGRTLLQGVSYLDMGVEPTPDISSVLNRSIAQTMGNGIYNAGVMNQPLSQIFIESL
jgi:hypothetical protein